MCCNEKLRRMALYKWKQQRRREKMSEQNCHTCDHVSILWARSALATAFTFLDMLIGTLILLDLGTIHQEGRCKPACRQSSLAGRREMIAKDGKLKTVLAQVREIKIHGTFFRFLHYFLSNGILYNCAWESSIHDGLNRSTPPQLCLAEFSGIAKDGNVQLTVLAEDDTPTQSSWDFYSNIHNIMRQICT